ncbi:MAG TPA: allantoinase AllB [Thermomicrobiales bacterium]|nr:allantoinase AllB [Thermomicrobiales bacterium]
MSDVFVIEGGTIVTHDSTFRADVVIRGEQIVSLTSDSSDIEGATRIDATGLLVLPGGIDAHTHFREPEEFTREGFFSGGQGAAAGGITTVVEMPQADPTTVTVEQFQAKRTQVARTALVDMALWVGVVGGQLQSEFDLRNLASTGAVAFKSFLASSSPSFPAIDTTTLHWAMRIIAETGLPYALHAEDDNLLASGLHRLQDRGRTDPLAHAESRPPLVESVAVAEALYLAEVTGCWVHICHCASADALRLVAEARARGVRVTVETCPQYLSLNTDDLVALKGYGRCAPSLRDQDEVDQIWSYVMDETIDLICSDHCGLTREQKDAGAEDIFRAPLGLAGVQTLLPVFFDAAVNQRQMSLNQFVRQMATNPAQIFELYPRKGTIAVGSDADLVIFDPDRTWVVLGEEMLHKQKWTPFEGKSVTGRVIRTIRRGEVIYDDSLEGEARLPGLAGSGRYLPRGYGQDGSSS